MMNAIVVAKDCDSLVLLCRCAKNIEAFSLDGGEAGERNLPFKQRSSD